MSNHQLDKARAKAKKLGVPKIQRHLLMCVDKKEADCASAGEMTDAWKYLCRRIKQLKLAKTHGIYRSPTHCLDVCKGGPILVVYPDGIWYGGCNEEGIERIIQQHLIGNKVVEDLVISGCHAMLRPDS